MAGEFSGGSSPSPGILRKVFEGIGLVLDLVTTRSGLGFGGWNQGEREGGVFGYRFVKSGGSFQETKRPETATTMPAVPRDKPSRKYARFRVKSVIELSTTAICRRASPRS